MNDANSKILRHYRRQSPIGQKLLHGNHPAAARRRLPAQACGSAQRRGRRGLRYRVRQNEVYVYNRALIFYNEATNSPQLS